jgi:hypothetical protein
MDLGAWRAHHHSRVGRKIRRIGKNILHSGVKFNRWMRCAWSEGATTRKAKRLSSVPGKRAQ